MLSREIIKQGFSLKILGMLSFFSLALHANLNMAKKNPKNKKTKEKTAV